MKINWVRVYNRLWPLIDGPRPAYFSGPRFLDKIREVDLDLPGYDEFINDRRTAGKSTSRKDYFRDVLLLEMDDAGRWRGVNLILEELERSDPSLVSKIAEIRAEMGGPAV